MSTKSQQFARELQKIKNEYDKIQIELEQSNLNDSRKLELLHIIRELNSRKLIISKHIGGTV